MSQCITCKRSPCGCSSRGFTVADFLAAPPPSADPVMLSFAASDLAADLTESFIAPVTGLYRLEFYAVVTATDASAGSPVLSLSYTDDSGFQAAAQPSNQNSTIGGATSLNLFAGLTEFASSCYPFEAIAGTVSISFTGGGIYGAARYSCYFRVVRLLP